MNTALPGGGGFRAIPDGPSDRECRAHRSAAGAARHLLQPLRRIQDLLQDEPRGLAIPPSISSEAATGSSQPARRAASAPAGTSRRPSSCRGTASSTESDVVVVAPVVGLRGNALVQQRHCGQGAPALPGSLRSGRWRRSGSDREMRIQRGGEIEHRIQQPVRCRPSRESRSPP